MTAMTADVVVIGGGAHGCSASLHLARCGLSVIQIEKDAVGHHASGVNAGGVRQLLRHPAEIPLSMASMRLWENFHELTGYDGGLQQVGQLAVAETEAELAQLHTRLQVLHSLGFTHEELLEGRALFEVVPALSRHCLGGLYSPRDGYSNPQLATLALSRAAQEAGARLLVPAEARGIERRCGVWRIATSEGEIEADTVVNCAGAWGGALTATLGEPVPIEVVAPMLMVTTRMPRFLGPVVIGTGRRLTFKQAINGTVIIGGGHLGVADPVLGRTELDFDKLAVSARTVLDMFPIMQKATVVRTWAGIEGRMPDDLPVLGKSTTHERAFHSFGFSAHGFQMAPITGAIIADLVMGHDPGFDLAPFSIARFSGLSDAGTAAPTHNLVMH